MSPVVSTILIGIGATAITDLWSIVRKKLLDVPLPNYGMVGRWFAHMTRGKFRHDKIANAEPVNGEGIIGWTAHYLIGITFAAILPCLWGTEWLRQPTLVPALLVGVATVLAPYLLVQPGMGAGFFASRTPHPAAVRLQSLATHGIFGLGLYITAWAIS